MKLSKLMILLLVFAAVLPAAISASAESGYYRGDADGDGQVTVIDASAVQKKIAELHIQAFNEEAADIDGNGLDINDATLIRRYLTDFENIYAIGEYVGEVTKPSYSEYELPIIP